MIVFDRVFPKEKIVIGEIELFLQQNNLLMDSEIQAFVRGYDTDVGKMIACGGVSRGGIIKCIAVDNNYRGKGIIMQLATELINLANNLSYNHLFIYTKPENEIIFENCGFTVIEQVEEHVVLLENSRDRLGEYCKNLETFRKEGKKIGSIVLNANPFTLGHEYLVKYAAEHCDWLHIFLVKEDLSYFSFKDRYSVVKECIKNMENVTLHEGSDYIISRATFPCYFIKDRKLVNHCFMELDLKIFRRYIAPALGITHRFVGNEPNCIVTRKYNEAMFHWLMDEDMDDPRVEVLKIDRKDVEGDVISASKVRKFLFKNEFEKIEKYVPKPTFVFLKKFAEEKAEKDNKMKKKILENKKRENSSQI